MSPTTTKPPAPKRPKVRVGRPSRDRAGEVDDRILDAAFQLFMERGLEGTSLDEIARVARASKPSIYARFATKEALFGAVILRTAGNVRGGFDGPLATGGNAEERLVSLGTGMLHRMLSGPSIDLMRLAVAELKRLPQLANVGRTARERGAQAISQVLKEIGQSQEMAGSPAFAPDRLDATTHYFLDLVISPFMLRALLHGDTIDVLRPEIETHVPRAVAFFLSACR